MAVSSVDTLSGPYTTNGVTTTFPFTFKAMAEGEVRVFRMAADGVETTINPGAYDVTLNDDGGSVVFTAAPAIGDPLYVGTDPDFTQQITFENQGAFLPEVMNEAFDRAATRDLALKGDIDRAPKRPLNWEDFEGLYPYLKADGTWGFSVSPGADGELRAFTETALPRVGYMRRIHCQIPFKTTTVVAKENAEGTKSYPNAMTMNNDGTILFVSMGCGPNVSAITMWDISNPVAPTNIRSFFVQLDPGSPGRETLISREVGATKYLYLMGLYNLMRYDITVTPVEGATLSYTDTGVPTNSQGYFDGKYWYLGSGSTQAAGRRSKAIFDIWETDLSARIGRIWSDIGIWGVYNSPEVNYLPKAQSMCVHEGKIVAGIGGVYNTTSGNAFNNSSRWRAKDNGIAFVDIANGEAIASYLCDAELARQKVEAMVGADCHVIENEGVISRNGKLFTLLQTLDGAQQDAVGLTRGLVVMEELSTAVDAVNFADGFRAARTTVNSAKVANYTWWAEGGAIKHPLTGASLTAWADILMMVVRLELPRFIFSTANLTTALADPDGGTFPADALVRIEKVGAAFYHVEAVVSGNLYGRWTLVTPDLNGGYASVVRGGLSATPDGWQYITTSKANVSQDPVGDMKGGVAFNPAGQVKAYAPNAAPAQFGRGNAGYILPLYYQNTLIGGMYANATEVEYRVGTLKVVGARRTGWAAGTGTATRTTFATSSVTLPQLAERVKALIDDLIAHGLIGA